MGLLSDSGIDVATQQSGTGGESPTPGWSETNITQAGRPKQKKAPAARRAPAGPGARSTGESAETIQMGRGLHPDLAVFTGGVRRGPAGAGEREPGADGVGCSRERSRQGG